MARNVMRWTTLGSLASLTAFSFFCHQIFFISRPLPQHRPGSVMHWLLTLISAVAVTVAVTAVPPQPPPPPPPSSPPTRHAGSTATATTTGPTITIAMAANTRFYRQELSILRVLRGMRYGKRYRLIVYDLGMTEDEAAALRCAVPTLVDEVRRFPFEKYPKHVKVLTCYSWKVGSVGLVATGCCNTRIQQNHCSLRP